MIEIDTLLLFELRYIKSKQALPISGSGQYISRPDTRNTFLRSLGELRNLRILALEYAHIADGTGGALLSLLPVIKRAHFRLQVGVYHTYVMYTCIYNYMYKADIFNRTPT